MSGFLHHLAAMSLGARPEGAARLSLPPRFAGLSGGLALRQEDADFASAAAPGHFEDHAAMRPEAPGLARSAEPPAGAPTAPARKQDLSAPMHLERQSDASPLEPRAPQPAQAPPRPARPIAPPPASRVPAKAAEPALMRLPAAAEAPPDIASEKPPARAPNRAMPLREQVLAGRTAEARAQAPVIHVTIDRIDVRAPAPSQPAAAPRRARLEPVVSLSEYLRGGGGGRG